MLCIAIDAMVKPTPTREIELHTRHEKWTGFNYEKFVAVRRWPDGRFAQFDNVSDEKYL